MVRPYVSMTVFHALRISLSLIISPSLPDSVSPSLSPPSPPLFPSLFFSSSRTLALSPSLSFLSRPMPYYILKKTTCRYQSINVDIKISSASTSFQENTIRRSTVGSLEHNLSLLMFLSLVFARIIS
jgi:hypothetical protein